MIKNKLKKYYKDNRIYPLNFNCKHLKACIAKAKNRAEFTTGHGNYIGSEYERGKIPKLLFLSLDSGSSESNPNKRTTETLSKGNINWLPGNMDKPKHWYRTHQFAWHVFNEINKASGSKLDIGKVDLNHDFRPLNEIHKIKPYFAHANSAKCCMNNEYRKQANPTLFKNCREYILGELEILRPDILITQGDPARNVAEEMKRSVQLIKKENISKANKNKDDLHILEYLDGRMLLWIHHYHPSNYKFFKKNRDNYATYAKRVAEFTKTIHTDNIKIFSTKTNNKSELLSDQATESDLEADKKKDLLWRNEMPLIQRSCIEHREGSGTQMVVSVLEEAWRKDEYLSSEDIAFRISSSEAGRHLISGGHVQDVKKRVKRVISWLSSEKYIIKKGGLIKLI